MVDGVMAPLYSRSVRFVRIRRIPRIPRSRSTRSRFLPSRNLSMRCWYRFSALPLTLPVPSGLSNVLRWKLSGLCTVIDSGKIKKRSRLRLGYVLAHAFMLLWKAWNRPMSFEAQRKYIKIVFAITFLSSVYILIISDYVCIKTQMYNVIKLFLR